MKSWMFIAWTKATLPMSPAWSGGILKKGVKTKIPTPAKRETKSLFGALNLKSGDFFWKSADRGNSKTFIEFLHQLRTHSKKTVVVIVDNATLHKSKKVKAFLKKHPDVILLFLPPYSPEYNPVEIIWRILKLYVVGARQISGGIKEVLSRIRKKTRRWSLGIEKLNVGPGIWINIFE